MPIALAGLLGTSEAADFKIFNGQKRVVINVADSHNPHRNLQEFLNRYHGGSQSPVISKLGTSSSSPVGTIFGRDMPLEIVGDSIQLSSAMGSSWLNDLPGKFSNIRGPLECPDCPVIFFAYNAHNPRISLGNGKYNDHPNSFLLCDTTSSKQIDRAVKGIKIIHDEGRKAGASVVFTMTPIWNWHHGRFMEYLPIAVREFNKRYGAQDYHAIDMVTPTLKDPVNVLSADRLHPTSTYGWYLYAAEMFRAMLRHDGLPDPDWLQPFLDGKKQELLAKKSSLRLISPTNGRYKIGDTITVKYETDCQQINNVWLEIYWRRLDTLAAASYGKTTHFFLYPNSIDNGDAKPRVRCGNSYSSYPWVKWGEVKYVINAGTFGGVYSSQAGYSQCACNFSDLQAVTGNLRAPTPVVIQVSNRGAGGQYDELYVESKQDWYHPENTIVFHPDKVIDPSRPIYPAQHNGPPAAVAESVFNRGCALCGGYSTQQLGTQLRIRGREHVQRSAMLVDMRGRIVLSPRWDPDSPAQLSTAGLSSGMYMLTIRDQAHSVRSSITVKK